MFRVLPILYALMLVGCASSEFRASGTSQYAPYDGEVSLMKTLPEPGSYELVGVVMVRGVGFTSDERMYDQLKQLAAERGANAVIPQGEIKNRPTTPGGEERRLAGYAIRTKQ